MKAFEFSVIASGLDPQAEAFESRLYDAGCDDATISFQKGHTIIDFAREADSIVDAIVSAVLAVRSVGAVVDRVEPDPLVSLAEIASRAEMTRAAITNYAKGHRGGGDFPAPVARVTSESPLWDWSPVARWLYINDKVEREVAVTAEAVSQANLVLSEDDSTFGVCLAQRVHAYEDRLVA